MRGRHRAFTLVELLVVMGIIVLILGTGVGVYGSMTGRFEFNRVRSELAGAFRLARTNALEHNDRVLVEVFPKRGEVQTTLRELLGVWHFEGEDQLLGADGHEFRGSYNFNARVHEIYRIPAGSGRFGEAIYFPYRDENAHANDLEDYVEPDPRLEIDDAPYWNPQSGIGVEMYLQLENFWQVYEYRVHEDREWTNEPYNTMRYQLFKKDRGYAVSVRIDGSLLVEVEGLDAAGTTVSGVFFSPSRAVVPGRWFRLVFELVRGWPRVLIDGVPVLLTPATPSAQDFNFESFPMFSEPFVIGSDQLHLRFAGALDALRIYGFTTSTSFELPAGYKLLGRDKRLVFDPDGFLDPLVHARPLTFRLADDEAFLAAVGDGTTTTLDRDADEYVREDTIYARLHRTDTREVTVELSGGVR